MNLIPEIRKTLEKSPRPLAYRSLRWAAAVMALLLVSTVTVYGIAMYQNFDPGLDNAEQQGLLKVLNQTQEVQGVEITVDQAYADANRIAIFTQYRYDAATTAVPVGGFNTIWTLYNADTGEVIPQIPMGGGGGGGGGPENPIVEANLDLMFDGGAIVGTPETINLRLEVTFDTFSSDMSGPPVGGGGGGGGGGDAPATDSESTPEAMPTQIAIEDFTPFSASFEFDLPFIPEYIVPAEELEPVTINDVTVAVNRLSITPSLTYIEYCYTLPDDEHLWIPALSLTTDDEQYTIVSTTNNALGSADSEMCLDQRLSVPYVPGEAGTWSFQVDYLRSSFADTAENAGRFQTILSEVGIEVEFLTERTGEQRLSFAFGTAGPMDDGMDFNKIVSDALASLGERIDGPWSFTFDVP